MDVGRCYVKRPVTSRHADMVFKVVMTGDPCCGKTSLMFRYIKKWIDMPEGSTVGMILDFYQPQRLEWHLLWMLLPVIMLTIWAMSWENLFLPYANNKGADQPAHLRSLISAFVVRCLASIIPVVAKSKISRLYLVPVAEQAGLSLTWSQTQKTGFLVTRLILYWCMMGSLLFTIRINDFFLECKKFWCTTVLQPI